MSEAAKKRLAKEAEAKQKKKRRWGDKADARAAYKEKLKRPKHDLEPSSDEDEPQKSDEDDDQRPGVFLLMARAMAWEAGGLDDSEI